MRYYPDQDAHFYFEISPGWDRYCRTPNKKWKMKELPPSTVMQYWRDLEGAKKERITMEDLYIKNWMTTRLDEEACLPLLYATGNRFIKVVQAFPAGFRCSPLPFNLKEAKEIEAAKKAESKGKKKGKKGKGKKGKKGKK